MKTPLTRRRLVASLLLGPTAMLAHAQAVREVHGAADAFAEPGLAVAWGVQRGADESSTRVWLRVLADPARYARIEVTGRDPFGGGTRQWLAATPITAAATDVVMPRAQIADHPRTEIHLTALAPNAAAVLVYYVGVPDTTPEQPTLAALQADLAARITRAQAKVPR